MQLHSNGNKTARNTKYIDLSRATDAFLYGMVGARAGSWSGSRRSGASHGGSGTGGGTDDTGKGSFAGEAGTGGAGSSGYSDGKTGSSGGGTGSGGTGSGGHGGSTTGGGSGETGEGGPGGGETGTVEGYRTTTSINEESAKAVRRYGIMVADTNRFSPDPVLEAGYGGC